MRHEAAEFNRSHPDEPIILVGNSYSLEGMDLAPLDSHTTIGCNRILRHETIAPTYLMIADREAYCQERDSGRLEEYVKSGGRLLLSETIFDPKILGRRADMDHSRQLPAQPEPEFDWHSWRVGSWHTKLHYDTLVEQLCSCANIVGPMIQAAAIMGAKKIAIIGVDLKWPKEGKSHFFGHGKEVGAFEFVSKSTTMHLLRKAKGDLWARGVEVVGCSPVKNTPFAHTFGNEELASCLAGK